MRNALPNEYDRNRPAEAKVKAEFRDPENPLSLLIVTAKLLTGFDVVVAAAGNNSCERKMWPAAFDDVNAVGALAGEEPAHFSNHGPWVDAWAPGDRVLSTFVHFDETAALRPRQKFEGIARWSGTSFAAPYFAACVAASMTRDGHHTAQEAAQALLATPR